MDRVQKLRTILTHDLDTLKIARTITENEFDGVVDFIEDHAELDRHDYLQAVQAYEDHAGPGHHLIMTLLRRVEE